MWPVPIRPEDLGSAAADGPAPIRHVFVVDIHEDGPTTVEPIGLAEAVFAASRSVANLEIWGERALIAFRELYEQVPFTRLVDELDRRGERMLCGRSLCTWTVSREPDRGGAPPPRPGSREPGRSIPTGSCRCPQRCDTRTTAWSRRCAGTSGPFAIAQRQRESYELEIVEMREDRPGYPWRLTYLRGGLQLFRGTPASVLDYALWDIHSLVHGHCMDFLFLHAGVVVGRRAPR